MPATLVKKTQGAHTRGLRQVYSRPALKQPRLKPHGRTPWQRRELALLTWLGIFFFSHCCDKILDKSNLKKEGSMVVHIQRDGSHLSWLGQHGGGSMQHLAIGSRKTWELEFSLSSSFSLLIQSGLPSQGIVCPTFWVYLLLSVRHPWKCLHRHIHRFFPGDFKPSQADNKNKLSKKTSTKGCLDW